MSHKRVQNNIGRNQQERELINLSAYRPISSPNGEIDDRDLEGETVIGGRERPLYRKKKEVTHMVNGGIATYPWANYFIESVRYRATSWSILAIVGLSVIFFFMIFGLTPPLPTSLLTRYGALEYLIWFPLYWINLAIGAVADRTDFYGMALFLNILAFLTYTVLMIIFFYHFLACSRGELPNSCKNEYWMDTIFFFPAILVFFGSFFCVLQFTIVVKQTSGTKDPIVYKVSQR